MVKKKTKNIIASILILIFIVLIIFGIKSGESTMVFRHAIKVCLECIGIG